MYTVEITMTDYSEDKRFFYKYENAVEVAKSAAECEDVEGVAIVNEDDEAEYYKGEPDFEEVEA